MSLNINNTYLNIVIPNLFEDPYIVEEQVLNSNTYFFEYLWNIRQEKAYLSIYLLNSGVKEFLVQSICLTNGIEVSRNIINDNFTGQLYFGSVKTYDLIDYNIKNISTDFVLSYSIPADITEEA